MQRSSGGGDEVEKRKFFGDAKKLLRLGEGKDSRFASPGIFLSGKMSGRALGQKIFSRRQALAGGGLGWELDKRDKESEALCFRHQPLFSFRLAFRCDPASCSSRCVQNVPATGW
jgi:hypothetical protein